MQEIYIIDDIKDNEILTYDSKNKITYNIPTGYTVRKTSDNYKTLEKGNASIRISSKISNISGKSVKTSNCILILYLHYCALN